MYIRQVDQLDLIDTYHVEVVSFELENNVYLNKNQENVILHGFFGSIATRTIGEASK
jgi:hypothetical protein